MNLRFPSSFHAPHRVVLTMLLAVAASGCDLPLAASSESQKQPTASRALEPSNASSRAQTQAPARQRDIDENRNGKAPLSARLSIASGADEIKLMPMEQTNDPRGNAILSLRFDDHRERPNRLILNVDGVVYRFARHKNDPAWYSGWIDFDFDLFAEEQRARGAFVARMKSLDASDAADVPTFSGRSFKGSVALGSVDSTALDGARLASAPLAIDASALAMVPGDVAAERELLINALSVVQDPARTFDICNNTGTPNGAWTFQRLMTDMANPSVTGINPSKFVKSWLDEWMTGKVVNGETIAARTLMKTSILDPWPKTAAGDLDLSKSPFRLLAIVNRVDLRKNTAQGLDAGEMRFVFGAIDRKAGSCRPALFTVILEYKVPVLGCQAVKNYAQRWTALGDLTIGTAQFNTALAGLTTSVTRAGAAPNNINGSAISQVRTNEIMIGVPWQLREFHIAADGQLRSFAVAQTPRASRDRTTLLSKYFSTNATAILNHRHTVPFVFDNVAFRGSAIANEGGDDFWLMPPDNTDPNVRHAFSIDTCNGCHGGETKVAGDLQFLHVEPRAFGAESVLSKFLVGDTSLGRPSTYTVPDPFNGTRRQFGELVRRRADLAALANSTCTATGLLEMATFKETTTVH